MRKNANHGASGCWGLQSEEVCLSVVLRIDYPLLAARREIFSLHCYSPCSPLPLLWLQVGPSDIVHGESPWFEMRLNLADDSGMGSLQ